MADNGKCERDRVERLSFDEPKVVAPFGVHGKVTRATAGTVGVSSSGS